MTSETDGPAGPGPEPEGASGASVKIVWAVVAVLLLAIGGFAIWGRGAGTPRATGLLETPLGELIDVPAVERSGAEISTHDLLGRFLVFDFIFTNCAGPCPVMTKRMAELQEALGGADDVRLVSVTTDPRRDSPEVLSAYADENGADPDKWWFLFTNKGNVVRLANDGMRIGGDPGEPMIHSVRFALLDRAGAVRGTYTPINDPEWKTKLLGDLDVLREEEPAGGSQ